MTPAHAPEIAEQRAGGAVVAGAGDPARAAQEIAHGGPLLAWRGWPAADRRTSRCSTADRPLPTPIKRRSRRRVDGSRYQGGSEWVPVWGFYVLSFQCMGKYDTIIICLTVSGKEVDP